MRSAIQSSSAGLSPAASSSSSNSRGRVASARTRSSIFCCALLRSAAGRSATSVKPVFVEQRGHRRRRHRGAAIGQRDLDILAHRQRQERLWNLEGAVDAAMNQFVRRDAADRDAIQHDLAAVGRIEAGDHVDRGGLAGAVGADQSQNFARTRRESSSRRARESRRSV